MLKKLTLTKFKKHENLSVDFSGGLVVIRGPNESGKSTLYNAISYALYGARGLPDSLEATVTYGYPASQLKVELELSHGGIDYKITRSKSGATITGGGTTAQGQAEVTSFITNLFQIKQDVASKITIANQSSLKASIEGGVAAVALIESLSGMDLIEELIGKIQDKLPCGNTTQIEQNIATLSESKAPVADLTALEAALASANVQRSAREDSLAILEARLSGFNVAAANETLREAEFIRGRRETLTKRRGACFSILNAPPLNLVLQDIQQFEIGKEAKRQQQDILSAYNSFCSVQMPTMFWQGDGASFEREYNRLEVELKSLNKFYAETKLEGATIQGQRINEDSCALCGKLLQDVPEVVATNTRVDGRLAELQSSLDNTNTSISRTEEQLKTLKLYKSVDARLAPQLARLDKYLVYNPTFPVSAIWNGPIPEQVNHPDYDALIKAEREKQSLVAADTLKRDSARAEVEAIDTELPSLIDPDIKAAVGVLAAAESLKEEVRTASIELKGLQKYEQVAQQALSDASNEYKRELAAFDATRQQLVELKKVLASYARHNNIISKLRQARPVVAKQLWTIVLHIVSDYFSQIRGVRSVVTKSDKGFMVDGKPYTDLSGSTVDSLGLAVRMALQKTFLPNLDFMLLDEPASGMDDNREVAMLGVLSVSGYNQVVMVTHSAVADSFAAGVVTL